VAVHSPLRNVARKGSLTGGTVSALGTGRWHNVALTFSGNTITAAVDGTTVGSATDSTWSSGQVAYATSQGETAQFDNLSITAGNRNPGQTQCRGL
jgi:hypothetical protein